MDENTVYDGQSSSQDEKTTIDNGKQPAQGAASSQPAQGAGITPPPYSKPKAAKKGMSKGAKIAAAAGGVALGGAVVLGLTSMAKNPDNDSDTDGNADKPDWLTGDVKVAEVSDDMSFDEAFAAAREQVGPGGAFEWHGQVYGTYTASEWNHMSAAEKAEWSDNFAFEAAGSSSSSNHTAAHTATHTTTHTVVEEHHVYDHRGPGQETAENHGGKTTPGGGGGNGPGGSGGGGGETGGDFQVLAVTHNDELDANFAYVNIKGNNCILMDADNDQHFDVMVVDADGDGIISEAEMENLIDISDSPITVAALGGFTDGSAPLTGDQMAMNDPAAEGPDYASEATREMMDDNLDGLAEHDPAEPDGLPENGVTDQDNIYGMPNPDADNNEFEHLSLDENGDVIEGRDMAEVYSAEPQTAEVEGIQAEVVSYGHAPNAEYAEVSHQDIPEGEVISHEDATAGVEEGAVTDTYGTETYDAPAHDNHLTDADTFGTHDDSDFGMADMHDSSADGFDGGMNDSMDGMADMHDSAADNFDDGLA